MGDFVCKFLNLLNCHPGFLDEGNDVFGDEDSNISKPDKKESESRHAFKSL